MNNEQPTQQGLDPTVQMLLDNYQELKAKKKLKFELGIGQTGDPTAIIKLEMPRDVLGQPTPPVEFFFTRAGVSSLMNRDALQIHQARQAVILAQENLDRLERRSQIGTLENLMTDVEACLNTAKK